MVEEEYLLEDGFVGFFEVVSPKGSGKPGNKLCLLLDVEQFLDVCVLLKVVIDLPSQRLTDVVLVRQLFEDLHVLALHDVLGTDVSDQ